MIDSAAPRRDKPWMFRTYAGHSTARESNLALPLQPRSGPDGLIHRVRSSDAKRATTAIIPVARESARSASDLGIWAI